MKSLKVVIMMLFSLITSLCLISISHAQEIPQLINYNGTLTDAAGNSVPDGMYDVIFTVYDASTAGNVLWTETWNTSTTQVVVTNGNFNAMLGAHVTIPNSFFTENPNAYLGVTVGTDSEMLPRQRIVSVGYAFTAGNGIPNGGIIMWSGAITDIPQGWALCDGTNGTPNLMDRFVVGAGNEYTVAATGGEKQHALSVSEMPSHTHTQNAHTHIQNPHTHGVYYAPNAGAEGLVEETIAGSGTSTNTTSTTATNQNTTATNQNTGGNDAHENRPPFYALAFIMKL